MTTEPTRPGPRLVTDDEPATAPPPGADAGPDVLTTHVHPHELRMYEAILGKPLVYDPSAPPVVPELADQHAMASPAPTTADDARQWSPRALAEHLRRRCDQLLLTAAARPQVALFLRRVTQSATRQIVGEPSRFVPSKVIDRHATTGRAA